MPKIYIDSAYLPGVKTAEDLKDIVEADVAVQVDPVTGQSYLWIHDEIVMRRGPNKDGQAFIAWDEDPWLDLYGDDPRPIRLTLGRRD